MAARRRYIVAIASTVAVLLAGCTGGGGVTAPESTSTGTDPSSSSTTPSPSATAAPEPTAEPELPRLPDVVPEPWEPSTRSDELLVQLGEGDEITPQLAVDIIGLMLPDLPGQTPSDLPAGEGLGDQLPVQLAQQMHDRFSTAQQAVIDEFLEAGVVIATIDPDGTLTLPAPDDQPLGLRGIRRRAVPIDEYPVLLQQIYERWDAYYPAHPPVTIKLAIVPLGKSSGKAAMTAPTSNGVCTINVYPAHWSDPAQAVPTIAAATLAHEIFHCFQAQWQGGQGNPAGPRWLIEGGADWAAADLFRDEHPNSLLGSGWFDISAAKPLEARTYDAWPLFEVAHDMGQDVYGGMQQMVAAKLASTPGTLHAGGFDGLLLARNWDASSLEEEPWGDPWVVSWPGTGAAPPWSKVQEIQPGGIGQYTVLGRIEFTHQPIFLDMTDVDIVAVSPTGAPLTTHTATGTITIPEGSTANLCFAANKCACPGGEGEGIPMDSPLMVFSFAVSQQGGRADVRAERWNDERCDSALPFPSGPAGHSNGDPHLQTFDGLPYDVMTLGEFVLARDPVGDLEIQTRHVPIGNGAGTSAVAIGTGGHRLTLTVSGLPRLASPIVRLDGEPVTATELDVGEAHASLAGPAGEVTWPDGTTITLTWFAGWFVTVETTPARAARMEGLLGSADGDLTNDLVRSDGTFADTSDAARDEAPVVLQWAVDEASTLFDYEPGQTPSTFRIPHPGFFQVDPGIHDDCSESLGPQALSHEIDACAFDVTTTGDDGYVTLYSEFVETRVATDDDLVVVPEPPPEPPPTGGPAGIAGEPTLVLGGDTLEGNVDAAAGTVLVAHMELCPEGEVVDVLVHRTDDDALAVSHLCDPSELGGLLGDADDEWIDGEAYLWLPDDGDYTIVVEPLRFGVDLGAIDIYIDPTPSIVRAGDIGSGGDNQTLSGIGDTVVYLTDPQLAYATEGLQDACAVEVYWTRDFPDPEPFDLGRCDHTDAIVFPPTDQTIPVVVFARTPGPIDVELRPAS